MSGCAPTPVCNWGKGCGGHTWLRLPRVSHFNSIQHQGKTGRQELVSIHAKYVEFAEQPALQCRLGRCLSCRHLITVPEHSTVTNTVKKITSVVSSCCVVFQKTD